VPVHTHIGVWLRVERLNFFLFSIYYFAL